MKIQAITRQNGAGLSKDVEVLREAFSDHIVDFTPWDRPRMKGQWAINFHLELVNPDQLRTAAGNVLVPNPEWFNTSWLRYMDRFDVVVAKTHDTDEIFRKYHKNVVYTGWTSPDPACVVDYSNPRVLHVAGKSIMKGTQQVIEAARQLPEIHFDLVVDVVPKGLPNNITAHQHPTPEQLCALRLAPIHLQPSTYEGFGHVLNEGRAMGALLITTDAGAMAEIVTTQYGFLVPPSHHKPKDLAVEQVPDVERMVEAIRIASDSVKEYGAVLGGRAREAYQADRLKFHERINEVIR